MKWNFLVMCGLSLSVMGCAGSGDDSPSASVAGDSTYLASIEPTDALPIGKARESAQDEESVTVVGVIGGSHDPFVDGLAAFTVVDPEVPFCSAEEGCPTPWDYCCTQDQVKNNIATVKLVDENGKPLAADARKLLNVKELSTVVVEGKASKDEAGNLTVSASKVFVRSGDK
ncbi:hypothetical protein Pla110_40730 [Polystyrenella longa]|uniref:Uncharacterized protein n=1 Tax=Polystyrenella longa TaxID=2528007 RepID=A0A518CSW5_9PLAN|nr:hypothetical protein [Polystyrenella longa]QDU82318.1 hypothetical protein Pla110_40730 [Polystyrenella longa]